MSELLQQDIPLPIILVANKSDLERNREVKIEGKFMAETNRNSGF
jgi:GTPase SAR1 family protein